MKAISIQQPWAWLIVKGIKSIENRTWKCGYRGPLLIHAGKTFDWNGYRWLEENMSAIAGQIDEEFEVRTNIRRTIWLCYETDEKFGGIVGSVDMVDCVEAHPSPFFCGPYGFVFNNAKELPFHPCRGYLNLFNVDIAA